MKWLIIINLSVSIFLVSRSLPDWMTEEAMSRTTESLYFIDYIGRTTDRTDAEAHK